ncbi:hypothetical protein Tco_0115619 [Tanacetum coccineum]
MSDLKFADSYNMVAFLEKPTECEGFEQIVDFQNAPTIKYALTVNPTIYASCIEQFWDTIKVKTVNEEVQIQSLVDRKKVIIIEASVRRDLQLKDAEWIECLPNDSIFEQLALMRFVQVFLDKQVEVMSKHKGIYVTPSHTKKVFANMKAMEKIFCGEDRLKLNELMELCTNLSQRVIDLENTKTSQAAEITELKERVKKLEKKRGSRNHKLKRLYKVGRSARVVSSEDEGQSEVEKEVSVADPVTTAGEVVTTASVEVSTTILTETTTVDELTLAQTLIEIKSAKPKVKKVEFQEPVQTEEKEEDRLAREKAQQDEDNKSFDEVRKDFDKTMSWIESFVPMDSEVVALSCFEDEDLIIAQTLMKMRSEKSKVRGVVMQEPSETATRPTVPPQQHDPKEKGKAKMVEQEKPFKKKDQIKFDEEVAQRLQVQLQAELEEEERLAKQREEDANIAEWDDVQAMMDADYELAARLQAEEQGELTIEEKSRLFMELIDKRKKHFARLGAEEQRKNH